jgi:hypothetical protein
LTTIEAFAVIAHSSAANNVSNAFFIIVLFYNVIRKCVAKLRNNFETAMTNGFDFGCPPIFLDEAKIFVWFCEKIVNGKWLNGLFFVTLHVEKCV